MAYGYYNLKSNKLKALLNDDHFFYLLLINWLFYYILAAANSSQEPSLITWPPSTLYKMYLREEYIKPEEKEENKKIFNINAMFLEL